MTQDVNEWLNKWWLQFTKSFCASQLSDWPVSDKVSFIKRQILKILELNVIEVRKRDYINEIYSTVRDKN